MDVVGYDFWYWFLRLEKRNLVCNSKWPFFRNFKGPFLILVLTLNNQSFINQSLLSFNRTDQFENGALLFPITVYSYLPKNEHCYFPITINFTDFWEFDIYPLLYGFEKIFNSQRFGFLLNFGSILKGKFAGWRIFKLLNRLSGGAVWWKVCEGSRFHLAGLRKDLLKRNRLLFGMLLKASPLSHRCKVLRNEAPWVVVTRMDVPGETNCNSSPDGRSLAWEPGERSEWGLECETGK